LAFEEEFAPLGEELAEPREVDLLLVVFDLGEVGVVREVEREATGQVVLGVEADRSCRVVRGGRRSRAIGVARALLDTGWAEDVLITIDGTVIKSVAAAVPPPPSAERGSGIAIPGAGNLHSHSFQRAMAGLAERRGDRDDSFWTWREVMYRFLARMTPDDIEAVTAWLYAEMLEAGFTTVGEFHYLHNAPDGSRYAEPSETAGSIAAAASASGIGLTLLPCFYAHGGCGGQSPAEGQTRFLSDLDGFAKLMEGSRRHLTMLGRGVLGIAPHSLRAVTPDELTALLQQHPTGPVHIHAAEQTGEVEQCVAWSAARPSSGCCRTCRSTSGGA
jgi:formiminoglutamate deiminase